MGRVALALVCLVGCSRAPERLRVDDDSSLPQARQQEWPTVEIPVALEVEPARSSLDMPDTCRRLLVVDTPTGPQLSKERSTWLANAAERARRQADLRRLIAIVADEMGADPIAAEVLWRKAILESSGDPSNVHVLSSDIRANRSAAAKGRARSSARWARARVAVHRRGRGGALEVVGERDAWALGRGLFGQVTGLHLQRWGYDVPPWSLCDPIVSTVTAIWSMRAGAAECRSRSWRVVYRRFSSGRCAERSEHRERGWDRLARGRVRGLRLQRIDAGAEAVLGERWPESGTDRAFLLARLRQRVGIDAGPA